jgi:acetyl esterase/lipase
MIFSTRAVTVFTAALAMLYFPNTAHTKTPKLPAQYVYKTIGQRRLVVDIDYPKNHAASDARPAIVIFAGGAWRGGGTKQFQTQAKIYAGAGMVAIRAEYRGSIVDKVQVDSCVKDAISAMRWVRRSAKRLGIDPRRIVAAGGSAGGFLAASTWTTVNLHAKTDDLTVSPKPDALVLFNPVFDLVPFMEQLKMDPKEWTDKAKQISPNWNIKAGFPPTVILIGTKDKYLYQNEAFRDKVTPLGVKLKIHLYKGQPHAFFNRSPWREDTVQDSLKFLRDIGIL